MVLFIIQKWLGGSENSRFFLFSIVVKFSVPIEQDQSQANRKKKNVFLNLIFAHMNFNPWCSELES
jgi:hypothetical protein